LIAMADFWMASDEWREFWDPVGATVVGRVPAPEGYSPTGELLVVDRDDDGRRLLVSEHLPSPGTVTSARVFAPPPDWDGERRLGASDLTFAGEPFLYASREEAPATPTEQREKARKGWAF
jgi:hypothetical protein